MTRLVLAHTAAVAKAVAAARGDSVLLLAVGSEPSEDDGTSAEEQMCQKLGWEYAFSPNSPLGAKWNHGMCRLRDRADLVMCIGSDDLVSEGIIASAWDSIASGKMLWGCKDIYFMTYGPTTTYWPGYAEGDARFGEPIGCGRTLWSGLLDLLNWAPWPASLERGLDHGMWMKIMRQVPEWDERHTVCSMSEACGVMVDLKISDESIGGYAYELGVPANTQAVTEYLPAKTVAALNLLAHRPIFEHCEQPFVSACLMVKNEAGSIRACLESLHGHVDEVTVLDTGSTDGTPAIVEEYGIKVHHAAVTGPFDFAHYRNMSLKLGRGTWLLIMDGKDKLINGKHLREQLRQLPADAGVNAIAVHTQCFSDAKRHIVPGMNNTFRILKGDDIRSGKLKYVYAVHHQLTGVANFTPMPLVYVEKTWVDVTESAKRNLPVLMSMVQQASTLLLHGGGKVLERASGERNHAMLYLARTHMVLAGGYPEESESAKYHYEQAALYAGKLIDEKADNPLTWLTLFQAIEASRGMQYITELVPKAIAAYPNCVEMHWWAMRCSAAWIAALATQRDQFPLLPQTCPIPRLTDCSGFLRMVFKQMEKPE